MSDTLQLMHAFKRITGVGPRFDGVLSVLYNKPIVDLIRFDAVLELDAKGEL